MTTILQECYDLVIIVYLSAAQKHSRHDRKQIDLSKICLIQKYSLGKCAIIILKIIDACFNVLGCSSRCLPDPYSHKKTCIKHENNVWIFSGKFTANTNGKRQSVFQLKICDSCKPAYNIKNENISQIYF